MCVIIFVPYGISVVCEIKDKVCLLVSIVKHIIKWKKKLILIILLLLALTFIVIIHNYTMKKIIWKNYFGPYIFGSRSIWFLYFGKTQFGSCYFQVELVLVSTINSLTKKISTRLMDYTTSTFEANMANKKKINCC